MLPAVGYFWLAEIEVFNLLPLGTFQLRLSHGIKTNTLFRTNKKNNSLNPGEQSWLTSNADFVPPEMVSLEGPRSGEGSGGPRVNVGRCGGLVSFSKTLFISLTVSPSEKYSSSTSLAVLTRSRLAPVILGQREDCEGEGGLEYPTVSLT